MVCAPAKMIQAKKSLGQHFLHDENMARKIVAVFVQHRPAETVLEVGPGMGALTKYLLKEKDVSYYGVEADERMVNHLRAAYPQLKLNLIHADFLRFDFSLLKADSVSVIGNFPYNISSQILFKVYEERDRVPFLVGMFQKEVSRRIAAEHANKDYGILSVLIQAFYKVSYLFEVHEKCFSPPPNVKSAVIQLQHRKQEPQLADERLFRTLVKAGFNHRRKTLRNSLSKYLAGAVVSDERVLSKRAEQLSVQQWIDLANELSAFSRPQQM
jgi:16S rRNA (adenine1518-N6/adenine1519-N6)-dimethyltransferase